MKVFNHLLEVAQGDFVIFDLDVNASRLTVLKETNIYVARTLKEQLVQAVQKPDWQMTGRIAGLKIKPVTRNDSAHGLRGEQGSWIVCFRFLSHIVPH